MSKHVHRWVISWEVFASEDGWGKYRLIWCEKCEAKPPKGQFPVSLASAAGEVDESTPLVMP